MKSLISKYFPPPQFLKPPHIGISFSDLNVKAISFDKLLPLSELASAVVPLEKGSIVSGSIVNMDNVVKALTAARKQFNFPFAFFTIPDELAYIFSVTIPVGSLKDATEGVAFTIEENVPLALADTVFDFTPTQVVAGEHEYRASMVVVASVKKQVEKFIEALRQAGFSPVGAMHESGAIAAALAPRGHSGVFGVVHARENRIGIYLCKGSLVYFVTLRSVTPGDYKKEFLDEYEKFLDYCSKYNTLGENLGKVFVCGDFEYAKKSVEAMIGFGSGPKNVKLGNVWSNILSIEKEAPSIKYEDALNLAGPIGAVLTDPLS